MVSNREKAQNILGVIKEYFETPEEARTTMFGTDASRLMLMAIGTLDTLIQGIAD